MLRYCLNFTVAVLTTLSAASALAEARDPNAEPSDRADEAVTSQTGKPLRESVVGEAEASDASGLDTRAEPVGPAAIAIQTLLDEPVPEDRGREIKAEEEALRAFYAARAYEPVWVDPETARVGDRAKSVFEEIRRARDHGLEPDDLSFRDGASEEDQPEPRSPKAIALADLVITRTVQKYARYARGGRIVFPAEQLNSNLDRRPQLIPPLEVLNGIAVAEDPAAFLAGTHPKHVQFQRLREKLLDIRGEAENAKGKKRKKLVAKEKRILANMEMWRWMHTDLGEMHLIANVPEYVMRLVHDGEIIHTERVVVGETGKQSSIFTRPLKEVVFRPQWRVPDSIKARELWPSLLKGGAMFRSHGLQLETKDGEPLDYRKINWETENILDYEVVQPPGPKNSMGKVKFVFPSQHTIFIHDTPDKWMFRQKRRTLSHGCLRLRNPLRMAELVLAHDKAWESDKVQELGNRGPASNKVPIEKRIKVHIAYFTARVDDKGRLKMFSDIYGHEKRVRLALAGRWGDIKKGRDHLAPVSLPKKPTIRPVARGRRPEANQSANATIMRGLFGEN